MKNNNNLILFKDKLFNFFYNQNILKDVVVLTSKEKQSIETISFFNQVKELDCLYKMNYGNYNGKTNNNFFTLQAMSQGDQATQTL